MHCDVLVYCYMSCRQLWFSCSSCSFLHAIKCNSCDDFRERISTSSMTSLRRSLGRIYQLMSSAPDFHLLLSRTCSRYFVPDLSFSCLYLSVRTRSLFLLNSSTACTLSLVNIFQRNALSLYLSSFLWILIIMSQNAIGAQLKLLQPYLLAD